MEYTKEAFKGAFSELVDIVAEKIRQTLANHKLGDDMKEFNVILKAFNRFQEDECDGCEYFFNVNNPDDLICCIKGGLTAGDISSICKDGKEIFWYGQHYAKPKTFSLADVAQILHSNANNIAYYSLLYCSRCKEYAEIYETYLVDYYLENCKD